MKRLLLNKPLRSLTIALVLLVTISLIIFVRFDFKQHFRGIYLLKGTGRYLFEVKNDLFLGEGKTSGKLIYGINMEDPRYKLFMRHTAGVYLDCIWDKKNGSGYVRSYLPGGRQLLTIFSRFIDDNGKVTHGLFVGGGLPRDLESPDVLRRNDTGMSYFVDGKWYHTWCNVNEAIFSGTTCAVTPPSDWKFLGSGVRRQSDTALEIWSANQALVDGVPVRIDKTALFRIGDTYFTFIINISNVGNRPVVYGYGYGDEPWVGNWGSARGNVGWVKDRIVNTTGYVDTKKYGYAGIFDYGNSLIGEQHEFTLASCFLEWFGPLKPNVYFSNEPNIPRNPGEPLQGDGRFIGLEYGPLTLLPGHTDNIVIAVGAATYDLKTGMPSKPFVDINYERNFAHIHN